MAKRTFLSQSELEAVRSLLSVSSIRRSPTQGVHILSNCAEVSEKIGKFLLQKLENIDGWSEIGAVALGSWARGELTPSSDIDLLLFGDEKKILEFANELNQRGLRLRYRTPEDMTDWTAGVEPFDVLAVLQGKALNKEAEPILEEQKEKILQHKIFKKQLITAMRSERKERGTRHDSVANFLEPNLKFGPGGLRDLNQAKVLATLFPDKFLDANAKHALEVLDQYNTLFLTVRQILNLFGSADLLSAQVQLEIAEFMGFKNSKEFMWALQMGLSRVNFYSDWMFQRSLASKKTINGIEFLQVVNFADAFKALQINPGVLTQGRVRAFADNLMRHRKSKKGTKEFGKQIGNYLKLEAKREFFDALFRSRVLEIGIPHLARVRGLSQPDHYHRYTVDEHTRQAVRMVKTVYDRPKILGELGKYAKSLSQKDWQIILWTALYHDLGKGMGGDHSTRAENIVKADFIAMGFSLRQTVEVAWMVRNHLTLSTAAFRMNPESAKTWARLHNQGVSGKRLIRLAIFTAIDIIATNPEAWSPWKERLLSDLVKTVQGKKATRFMDFLALAEKRRIAVSPEYLGKIDPMVISEIPSKRLLDDYVAIKKTKKDLPLLVVKSKGEEVWIRFHRKTDERGIFLEYLSWLQAAGASIQQCSVNTLESYGVYDWFHVKIRSTIPAFKKRLSLVQAFPVEINVKPVLFESMQLVSEGKGLRTLSLRGKDRKGLLKYAALVLKELGAEITWAKAHTWGRRIDDVFSFQCEMETSALKKSIESRLIDPKFKESEET